MRLLTNAGAGTGASVKKEQALNRDLDQFCTLYVWGTFNGATVTLQVSPDNTNWFDSGVSITAQTAQNLEFRAQYMRAIVTGGASPSINALIL